MRTAIHEDYPRYTIYSNGLIYTPNKNGGKKDGFMKPAKDARGYLRTMLKNRNGNYSTVKVHRIIAESFLGKTKNLTVNHKNGIKTDNRIENLEWLTHLENCQHARENGLLNSLKGEQIGTSLLKEYQVLEIRKKFIPKKYTRKMLAIEYNVKESTIKDILSRKSWKHLE